MVLLGGKVAWEIRSYYHIVILMVEVQQSITNFLMHMDQAGVLVGLVLGFVLGLMTALLIFYQAVVRA